MNPNAVYSLVMFEKMVQGGIIKFYTMIEMDDGTFDANYGSYFGEEEWTKTKNYPIGQWQEVYETRENHGYQEKYHTQIDLQQYRSCKAKLDRLAEVLGDQEKESEFFEMYRCLLKWGYLSKEQMKRANRLFEKSLTSQ